MLQPRSRNSTNRRRLADCGRRPGLFFTRRDDDNTTPKNPGSCCDRRWKPPRRQGVNFGAALTRRPIREHETAT